MARFDGFIGGSYTTRAIAVSAQRCINFFVESVEDPGAKQNSQMILLSKPGLQAFATVSGASSVAALLSANGRCFVVAGTSFCEISSTGTVTVWGTVAADTRPQMEANQTQVFILAAGMGYVFTLARNSFAAVSAPGFPLGADKLTFIDGYFILLESNSQNFAISGLNDGTSWDALDFGDAEGEMGNVVTFVADHRQLWLLGNTHSEVYYDSGNANFPFSRLEGAFMEQGCSAIDSAVKCDNTIFWLGGNRDGQGIVWRANGYTPQRISTHAVEAQISNYPTISDATAYAYQDGGHTFYVLHFPSARNGLGATWVYDAASGYWHERGFWNAGLGAYQADLARTHCFAFGLHLVGDYQSGNIYQMSQQFYTDNGALIRRERVAPDLANGGEWTVYNELRLTIQSGVGVDGAGSTAIAGGSGGISGGNTGAGGGGLPGPYSTTNTTSDGLNVGSANDIETKTWNAANAGLPIGTPLSVSWIHIMPYSATAPGGAVVYVQIGANVYTVVGAFNQVDPHNANNYLGAIASYQLPTPQSIADGASWTCWTEHSTTQGALHVTVSSTSLPEGF